MSPDLLCQMAGRGFRLHPGKQNCLILDYGGNILRHGPIDLITAKTVRSDRQKGEVPAKLCPECHALIATAYATCPDCGHEFPAPQRARHDGKASGEAVLSGEVTITEHKVLDVFYTVHTKRGADEDAPKTMRVDCRIALGEWVSEWVCFEHTGYARRRAEDWWAARTHDHMPDTSTEAVVMAEARALAPTESITIRHVVGERFDRIVDYKLGPKPDAVPVVELDFSEVPF